MRIFLSYRRDDAVAWAGRLYDALAAQFDQRNLWQDVTTVRPGENFRDAIDAALAESDVVLAVIGPSWLTTTTSTGELRLAMPDDYVRIELAAALAQGKQVIPVLVGGATMPTLAQLPEDLEGLGLRQAVVLHDTSWHQDVDGFIGSLRGEPATTRGPRWVIPAALIALLLVGGLAGWLVFGRDGEESANGNPGAASSQPGSAVTEVTATTVLDPCTTPTSDWADLGVTGSTDVGQPGWHFTVSDGHEREDDSGRWDVVLRIEGSQDTDASQTHYAAFYELAVDGNTYEPNCFVVVGGQNPLSPGASSEALVGFDLPDELTGGFALDLDTFGEVGRIDLEPAG